MKSDDETRRRLSEMFEDFELEPQAESWENIRRAVQPRRKRRFFWLFFRLGCALMLLSAGLLVWQTRRAMPVATVEAPALPVQKMPGPAAGQPAGQMPHTPSYREKNLPAGTNGASPGRPVGLLPGPVRQSFLSSNVAPSRLAQATAGATDVAGAGKVQASPAVSAGDAMAGAATRAGLSELPLNTGVLPSFDRELPELPEAAAASLLPARIKRRAAFTADISLLSAFRQLESQWYGGLGAANIRTLATFDARRLGASLSLGYRLPLSRRSDLGIAMVWMNLPYRAEYAVASVEKVQVELISPSQYQLTPALKGQVSDVRRLNWLGLRFDYGYNCMVLGRDMRVFAGMEGLFRAGKSMPDIWGVAGLEMPLGRSRFWLTPKFQYQFGHIEQPDHLLKTRTYAFGIGLKTKF